ncbi:Hypothetical predicted protein, partial [Olea europaea subsp. europaea]
MRSQSTQQDGAEVGDGSQRMVSSKHTPIRNEFIFFQNPKEVIPFIDRIGVFASSLPFGVRSRRVRSMS